MKLKFLISLFFVLLSSESFANLKKSARAALPTKKFITVTGNPDYPPIVWRHPETNELKGVAVELITMAFKELDVTVKAVGSSTWGRAQEEVKSGRIDMLLPPYLNEERTRFYEFYKNPILMDETAIFLKKGKKLKYLSNNDLIGLRGVAIIGDSFGSVVDQFVKSQLTIERLTKTKQCFDFLLNDRADYMIMGLNAGMAVIQRNHLDDKIEVLPKRVITTGMYAPISKKSPWNKSAIHDFINGKIAEYNKSGLTQKLEKKYWRIYNLEN